MVEGIEGIEGMGEEAEGVGYGQGERVVLLDVAVHELQFPVDQDARCTILRLVKADVVRQQRE